MASIRARLMRLENNRRFLNWFAMDRFLASLTDDELVTYAGDGELPEPIPNRPSPLDRLDRKTLLKLWEEDERIFGGRSQDDLDYCSKNGIWPEQKGHFHYSMQDGNLRIEWRNEPEEEDSGPARAPRNDAGPGS
jgi:hypothetical protein